MPSLILGHGVLANDVAGVTLEFWTCEFSKVVVVTLDHEERCQAKDAAGGGCAHVRRGWRAVGLNKDINFTGRCTRGDTGRGWAKR